MKNFKHHAGPESHPVANAANPPAGAVPAYREGLLAGRAVLRPWARNFAHRISAAAGWPYIQREAYFLGFRRGQGA